MGALGEGSGWDLRIYPAAAPAAAVALAAASGNLGTWKSGNLGIWRSGDLEIQKLGDLGTWKSRNLGSKKSKKNKKLSKFKSVLLKMSARSGLV